MAVNARLCSIESNKKWQILGGHFSSTLSVPWTGCGQSGHGMIEAQIQVHVPAISTRRMLRMHFPASAGPNREDWVEIAYDRALEMLDLAWKAA